MKKAILLLFATGIVIGGAVFAISFMLDNITLPKADSKEIVSAVFTDQEIEMLNNYESKLYQRLGSTSESLDSHHYFTYFDIPDSVINTHEFTFYLLEFRQIREIHAFGTNEYSNSYVSARTLDEDSPLRRNLNL